MSDNQTTMSQGMGRIIVVDVIAAIILFFVLLATVSVFAGLIALVISLGLLPILLIWFIVHRVRKRRAGDAPAAVAKSDEEPQAPLAWVVIANVIAALALFFILWAVLSVFAAVVGLVIGLGVLPVALIVYIVYRMRKKRAES